jgi:1-deoxy-D-xylulose-5-phosphate reductoisomerase
MKRKLAVFGSTGTIGLNTLALARQFSDRFEVVALTGGRNLELLSAQISEFKPRVVVVQEESARASLSDAFPGTEFLWGDQGLVDCAAWDGIEIACQGIVGFAAMAPTLELARRGKAIALANKETLVVAGNLLKQALALSGAQCIPVDSEHNAIFQLLVGRDLSSVASIVLTASGGPFWRETALDLSSVTPAQAVKHPNWKMGPKISVDSATLMNKGLEVVEAHVLFGTPMENIEVWIHPQSIVHGALWFTDGTCQAQLSKPDMKASIGYALGYPERLPASVEKLTMRQMQQLDFAEPDTARFPCLGLPRKALAASQSHLIALNGANEVAVSSFLEGRIRFTQISSVLEQVLDCHHSTSVCVVEDVFTVDRIAREKTASIISQLAL